MAGLRIDHSKRFNEMIYLLNSGKELYSNSKSYDEKKRGLMKCVQGMKELDILLQLEQDQFKKNKYMELRESNNKELGQMIERLEEEKKGLGKPMVMKL